MSRKTRLLTTFALAILLPGAALAALGFRAIRAEDLIRQANATEQARSFVRLAASEIRADLESWLKDHPEAHVVSEPPPEPVDLQTALARERPDLTSLLNRAEALEFRQHAPAKALPLYRELASNVDHDATRVRLLFRAARCTVKAGDAATARPLLQDLAREPAIGESGIPVAVSAQIHLIELGDDLRQDVLAAPLPDPATEVVVLRRLQALGTDVSDRLERASAALRALAWARDNPAAEIAWFESWVAFKRDSTLCIVRPDAIPREPVRRRLEEIARLGHVTFDLSPAGPATDFEAPVIDGLRVTAAITPSHRSSGWGLLAGFVILLVVAMALGLVATLRALNRELRLAQLKSDFVSGVSHELRTPLTSVRMFSELVVRPDLDEPRRREYAELLQQEALRLARLVERVLDFARLERHQPVYSFEPRDLREVVADAIRRFRPAREFEIAFRPPPEPVRAGVDAEALEQALHNLFDNAVKYAPDERAAEVTLAASGNTARIEVRDRGSGIDPKDQPLLFEKFYRGTNPLTIQVPGTGLGLAIVRQILEAHNGRARVESVPGRGSTFIIEIPLWRAS